VTRLGTSVLLFAYRLFRRPLQTGPGRRLFLFAYGLYKRGEARDLPALQPLVARGSTVIDVGANVGYFTRRFAAWVLPGGRVLALEPEARNAADLRRLAARHHWTHVECLQAAAADRSGTGRLALNPFHPADHRLSGTTGDPVRLVTVDELIAARGWPAVSLIKIDVQGAELAVIDGAVETIRRSRPALYVEVDDEALLAQGASARALAARLEALGYVPHAIDGTRVVAVTADAIVERSASGRYTDILWLST
jgi:FkbM family methyltransferase